MLSLNQFQLIILHFKLIFLPVDVDFLLLASIGIVSFLFTAASSIFATFKKNQLKEKRSNIVRYTQNNVTNSQK